MIVARVRRTLRERALLDGRERVLVACSGGPDSAALLHVLHRLAEPLRLDLRAASVDHGLRADSVRDIAVAGELARGLGVPFEALQVRVETAGPSLQSKARRARYEALLTEARRQGASRLAVGHTLDDQAETVLARILRGSGVTGLSGIEPRRNDGVIRPLIDCRRDRVHAYVRHHALPCVADPSNDDPTHERVRLRRTLLPSLAMEDARVVEHLSHLADDARAVRAMVRLAAADLLDRAAHGPRELAREPLRAAPAPVRTEALARWVHELTGTRAVRAHLDALESALIERGEALLPGGFRARAEGEHLVARHVPEAPTRSRPKKE